LARTLPVIRNRTLPRLPRSISDRRGQSVAEFALILPVMLLIAVAVGDFGRIYASIIALESATREAADFGAFQESNWANSTASDATLAEMRRRACTAASSMPGYAGAPDNTSCTNPVFDIQPPSELTADYGEGQVPIVVVRGTFTFTMAVSFPPLPENVTIVRESRFAVSDLPGPLPEGSPDPSIPAPASIAIPTESPSPSPSESPSESPSGSPSESPSATPTEPPATPTPEPPPTPTPTPTPAPTPEPTPEPTPSPPPDPTPTPNPNQSPP
jgi:Flp pilus assembly protein TadG